MMVQNADKCISEIVKTKGSNLKSFEVTDKNVLKELKALDTFKRTGPDKVISHTLKNRPEQLAITLAALFITT